MKTDSDTYRFGCGISLLNFKSTDAAVIEILALRLTWLVFIIALSSECTAV